MGLVACVKCARQAYATAHAWDYIRMVEAGWAEILCNPSIQVILECESCNPTEVPSD